MTVFLPARTVEPIGEATGFAEELDRWVQTVRRAAEALSHDAPGWAGAWHLLFELEATLAERWPMLWPPVQVMLAEVEDVLLHPGGTHPLCSRCRAARGKAPVELPPLAALLEVVA